MAVPFLTRRHILRPEFRKPVFRTVQARFDSSIAKNRLLVTPAELAEALKKNPPSKISADPKTIAVCGTWYLPNDPQKRTGYGDYKKAHIRKARFFDLDKVADTASPYPHMLPSPEAFQEAVSSMGINRDDTIVVYDSAEAGIFSAPRVAWTFGVFGHPYVHILNNFKLWVDQGYAVEEGEQRQFEKTDYPLPHLDAKRVSSFEDVRIVAFDHNKEGREDAQILDARSAGRFAGKDPEPRPGLPSGHMPGAISIPVPELLDPETKAFLPPDQLRDILKQKGVDPNKRIISSCGTGVTATIIDTALAEAGYGSEDRQVYDGSWTEWAQRVQASDNLIVKER